MYTGPKLTNENLVFGYDTGYGLDQHSSTRHYKGEPATNLITAGLPGYFGSGGETLYKSNFYGLNSDSGVFQRNFVTNPALTNSSTYNNNAGLYKNFTTAALSSNTEYLLVSFDFYMIIPYVRHTSTSTGLNGYMGVLYTDGSTGNHSWNTSLNTPNAGDDWNNNSAYIGQWRKIALYIDLTDAKTPASISSMYIYNDRTVTGNGIFTNFVITEHATVPTGPVLYTSGTRSDTASLIDLKKTTDIDVGNVSFDSAGQPTFDGTNDYINIPSSFRSYFTSAPVAVELVLKKSSSDQAAMVVFDVDITRWNLNYNLYTSGQWAFDFYDGTEHVISAGNYDDEYVHFVLQQLTGGTMEIYANGILKGTITTSGNLAPNSSGPRIGSRSNGDSRYYKGELPVFKIYSSSLSTTEIKNNFNAYKNRFNI